MDGLRVDLLFAGGSFDKAAHCSLPTARRPILKCPRFVRHQYSSANMIVITRSVTEGSEGSGE